MSCQVDGSPDAPIMLIGMAPGRHEIEEGKPFVGGSGYLLWQTALTEGRFTRADCYIVNVIGEFPAKGSGKEPSAEQLIKYRTAFEEAVAAFRGRLVVPLGTVALKAATGLAGGIEQWRGYIVSPEEAQPFYASVKFQETYKRANKKKGINVGDPKVVLRRVLRETVLPRTVERILPTLHPAGVVRSGWKTLPAFVADIRRVGRALRKELYEPLKFTEVRGNFLPTGDGPFLIDVETSPFLRIGMAGRVLDAPVAWTAPLSPRIRHMVNAEFAKPGRVFVAHNAQFDLAEMEKNGMPWRGPVFDTMLAAHLLEPDLYKGLNEVASLYLDIPRWKHLAAEDEETYNLTDVKREFELYEILRNELREEGMLELFEGTVMPAMTTLARMTRDGIKLHGERHAEWLKVLVEEQKRLIAEWQSLVGNVSPTSSRQIVAHFYRVLKLPLKYKKDGGETAEKSALYELLNELEPSDPRRAIVSKLLEIRKNGQLLRNYAKRAIGPNGTIHPYYLPVTKDSDREDTGRGIAGTGRIQARGYPIQQLPPVARRMVIPHKSESVIVSFDFKQLELRIAAALSGDEALKRDLELGIFERVQEKLGCDRTRAKNVVYGTIYGGGPAAIQKALRAKGVMVTRAEAKEMQEKLAQAYPTLWLWRAQVMASALATMEVRNPYSRLRHFYDRKGDAPAAVDFLPQSTAADVVWSDLHPDALPAIVYSGGGFILATVHDEFVVELPREGLDDNIAKCKALLERHRPEIGISLPVGVKVGDNWGDVKNVQPVGAF